MRRWGRKETKSVLGAMVLASVLVFLAMPFQAFGEDRLVIKDDLEAVRMTVTDQGRIGIDTTTPQQSIDLGGGGITVNGADTSGTMRPGLKANGIGRIDFGFGGNGGGNLEAYSKNPGGDNWNRKGEFRFIYGGGADYGKVMYIHYNGSSWGTKMTLDHLGYLTMWDGAYCNGAQWIDGSSREYKEEIRDLDGKAAFRALESMDPVTYKYKTDSEKTHVGFIAEDVPDLVATKDRKGVNPVELIAVLTKVVKEQQKVIAELQEKLDSIDRRLR